MQHIRKRGAIQRDAKTDANVGQPARVCSILIEPTPRAASVKKHGTADPQQTKRIPVGVGPLLKREQCTALTGLIARWIATQAIAAPQQQLIGKATTTDAVCRHGSVEQRRVALRDVVTRNATDLRHRGTGAGDPPLHQA